MLELGKYIWKANGLDYPVIVVEFLGKGSDGREYARVLDSNTAVPVDELHKETSIKSISKKTNAKKII